MKKLLSLALLLSMAQSVHAMDFRDAATREAFIRHTGCQFFAEGATRATKAATGREVLVTVGGINLVTTSDAAQAVTAAVANFAHADASKTTNDKATAALVAGAKVLAREKAIQAAGAGFEKLQANVPALATPEFIKKNSGIKDFLKKFTYYTAQFVVDGAINNASAKYCPKNASTNTAPSNPTDN